MFVGTCLTSIKREGRYVGLLRDESDIRLDICRLGMIMRASFVVY